MTSLRQVTFVGIGAQKSATTWLHGTLGQSPHVTVSPAKEVDFFSYHFDRGYEWYERRFLPDPKTRHAGEVSPSYLIHPEAPQRAAGYNPDLQIFVILRDPVSRAYSNHLHEVKKGHVSGDNLIFERGLENNPLYLEQGLYARHLGRWLEAFPATQIHVFYQETIQQDRAMAAARVMDVLGVPRLADFVDRDANESVRYRNAAIGQSLHRVGVMARRAGLGQAVERLKALPGIKQMHAANRAGLRDIIPPMRPETEAHLRAFFQRDVAALEGLTGERPPWPRFG